MPESAASRVQTDQQPRATFGIEGLDYALAGGLIPGRIYLIEGEPGAGKTTLSLQFLAEGARKGEPGLYVTLSESAEEVRAVAASHGWDLAGIEICEMSDAASSVRPEAQYTMFHPSEVELSATTRRILDAIERVKPKRAVFDSLSEMRLLAQNPLRYRRQILALKQVFTAIGCTVLLLDDDSKKDADQQLRTLSHGVLCLEHLAPEYGAERRRMRILKMRGVQFRGGFHDFVIRKGGVQVFPRLVAADHVADFQREQVPSGVSALDQLLLGGLDRGTSTLLVGPAGAGKSTLATQYCIAAAERGDHATVFTFDESVGTLFTRSESLSLDLKSHVDAGRIEIRQVDPAELSPGEFAHAVRAAVEEDGSRVVVIDSLNGYLNAMSEERFMTIQLHELLTYLGHKGVITLMVVAQFGLTGAAVQAAIDASYLADSILLLRYFEAAGEVRQAISVLKKRSGAHERSIRELKLGPGINVGPPLNDFQGVLTGVPTFLNRHAGNGHGPGK